MGYAHRLDGGGRIKLNDFDTGADSGLKHEEAAAETQRIVAELIELQELLAAARQQSVLVILQGRDTSGKDGTIRNVTSPLNSQSCSVASFKQPSAEELAHDFLWRIHAQTPPAGQIRIFNRSHYEDVLVVRVHELAPKRVWRNRYDHINAFERMLTDSGTIVLKFYLHISKHEQKQRLVEREKNPLKSWKLSVGDWKERELWDDYTAAYEDALSHCSTANAPWHIVPADKKWFRNLAVAEALRDALKPLRKEWAEKLDELGRNEKKVIDEYRRGHGHSG